VFDLGAGERKRRRSGRAALRDWAAAVRVYADRRVAALLCLGFSAGLPFLLIFATLSAWLREAGLTATTIGFFSWAGLTFSVKVLWAPVVDRVPVPGLSRRLGRRRAWMLLAQFAIAAGLLTLAASDPAADLGRVALCAVAIAFFSATQDVAIDAYRIEAAAPEVQGAMAAAYVLGYRLGLLAAGAGALYLAEFVSWPAAYTVMAAAMAVGIATTLAVAEPQPDAQAPAAGADGRAGRVLAWLRAAFVAPLAEFLGRHGVRSALLLLVFVAVYRISDLALGVMANPFYLDLGFTKAEIASVTKVYGFAMAIAGAAMGGVLVARLGVRRPLLLGAVLVAGTNLLFAWLAQAGADLALLAVTVSADNLAGGLAGAVFVAYLSALTATAYTATQYALFSSLMTLPGKFLGGFSGMVVDAQGYAAFFVLAAALGLPAILLACWAGGRPAS